jgi:hypothetical protein
MTVLVPGMTCRHCVRKVTAALRDVAGVALVQADAVRARAGRPRAPYERAELADLAERLGGGT